MAIGSARVFIRSRRSKASPARNHVFIILFDDDGVCDKPRLKPRCHEATRVALRDWLTSLRLLRRRDDSEGVNLCNTIVDTVGNCITVCL
jgi:hypothetical protein